MKFKLTGNSRVIIILIACFAFAMLAAVLFPTRASNGNQGHATEFEFDNGENIADGQATLKLRHPTAAPSRAQARQDVKVLPALDAPRLSALPLNQRVLVVYNANVPASLDVADHYIARRNIPQNYRCAISPSTTDYIRWNDYDSTVKTPIKNCLNAIGRDQILYIVFAYGTPFALEEVPVGEAFRIRSLDQYVADIWDEYSSDNNALFIEHPYYAPAQSQGNVYQPFVSLADYRSRPEAKTIYSVWRLDAASDALAKGLVDKAIAAETNGLSGQGCFDRNRGDLPNQPDYSYVSADWDIHRGADFAAQAGFSVVEDGDDAEFGTPPAPLRCDNALLYTGWYSFNAYNDVFTWNPGAIGFHLDSASAVNPRGGTNWSANAIINGITVTSGAVSEPYLEGLAHSDGVFRNLFEGANVGDAFLRNTAYLKWMIINLGDPLYRPFPNGVAPFNSPNHRESSLALEPNFVFGGNTSVGTVTLNSPAPQGGALVNLTDNSALVSVPPSITIPGGETSATFTITTNSATSDTAVMITASYAGTTLSNTLIVGLRSEGYQDEADCNSIRGWAWDRQQPNASINVDIYDGGNLLATVPANNFRQDLLEVGIGNGFHGFTYTTPASLKDGQPHSIHVRFAGTDRDLPNTGGTLTCQIQTPPPPSYEGYHDGADCNSINGWAWNGNQPNTPISVDIYTDNTLLATVSANIFRQDLLNAGKGNGVHGFNLATPESLKDGRSHSIRVRYAGTGTDLFTTPKTITCAAPVPTPTPTPTPVPTPASYYQFVARHSGKCMDVGGASTADAASVIQWECHGGANQQWQVAPVGDGYFRITARHSLKALEVYGTSLDDLAPVVQYGSNGGANQQWRIEPVGDGYYRVVARHSAKALDTYGASLENGAGLIQYSPHAGANQQWLLRPVE